MAAASIHAGEAATGVRVTPDLRRAALIGLALLAVVGLRWLAIQRGIGDPIVAGFAFGVALLAVAVAGSGTVGARGDAWGWRHAPVDWPRVAGGAAIGLAGGAALVALALVGRALASAPSLPPVFRADLFAPWALATVVVAAGEEAVLRGVLLGRLTRSVGLTPGVLLTSLAFALMHVPFYGWRVVPLDLGVGLWLAGLRLASRGLVAPTIAHALADLATWWL
ncbi:MAG TPA: CPBP family intramembrane glutamic endopeptidase [Candidatus Limnocylindrales bacterium]